MTNGFVWPLVLIAAILGNFVIRRFMKHIDTYEPKPEQPETLSYEKAEVEEIFNNWAEKNANYTLPSAFLPLHESFVHVLKNYQQIAFDETIRVYDRNFTTARFSKNPKFLQIGEWGDGSEVLIRLCSNDPLVYIADIEYNSPEQPGVLTKSFEEYLILSKRVDNEASEILREKGL